MAAEGVVSVADLGCGIPYRSAPEDRCPVNGVEEEGDS